MTILYIFPHPDDESFGPARAMFRQRRQGHRVHLLTLTRGEATRMRFKYGYSPEQMGEVRYREMLEVERVLDLSGMKVLDFPDSRLKELDPRSLEAAVRAEIEALRPRVVVTYAVHGVSGYHDHLVTHAVVKRVFVELRETLPTLKRLALFTITEEEAAQVSGKRLQGSPMSDIDCVFPVEAEDIGANLKSLDCYETYRETIERMGVRDMLDSPVYFELYGEDHDPPLEDVFTGLTAEA